MRHCSYRPAQCSDGYRVGRINCLCRARTEVRAVEEHPTWILEYVGSPPCTTSSEFSVSCEGAKKKEWCERPK